MRIWRIDHVNEAHIAEKKQSLRCFNHMNGLPNKNDPKNEHKKWYFIDESMTV